MTTQKTYKLFYEVKVKVEIYENGVLVSYASGGRSGEQKDTLPDFCRLRDSIVRLWDGLSYGREFSATENMLKAEKEK